MHIEVLKSWALHKLDVEALTSDVVGRLCRGGHIHLEVSEGVVGVWRRHRPAQALDHARRHVRRGNPFQVALANGFAEQGNFAGPSQATAGDVDTSRHIQCAAARRRGRVHCRLKCRRVAGPERCRGRARDTGCRGDGENSRATARARDGCVQRAAGRTGRNDGDQFADICRSKAIACAANRSRAGSRGDVGQNAPVALGIIGRGADVDEREPHVAAIRHGAGRGADGNLGDRQQLVRPELRRSIRCSE